MNYNRTVEYLENFDEVESKILREHLIDMNKKATAKSAANNSARTSLKATLRKKKKKKMC